MIKIGIVGDIGSGKSYIANNFGYPVFDADYEVSNLYKKDKKIFFKLKKNKILVKSNYLGNLVKTEQSIRITLGNKEQMKFFFDNLMKAL